MTFLIVSSTNKDIGGATGTRGLYDRSRLRKMSVRFPGACFSVMVVSTPARQIAMRYRITPTCS